MRLNETNRRRALQRRRKLMPEPRRISPTAEPVKEPAVLSEVPASSERTSVQSDLARIEQPEQEPAVVQH